MDDGGESYETKYIWEMYESMISQPGNIADMVSLSSLSDRPRRRWEEREVKKIKFPWKGLQRLPSKNLRINLTLKKAATAWRNGDWNGVL